MSWSFQAASPTSLRAMASHVSQLTCRRYSALQIWKTGLNLSRLLEQRMLSRGGDSAHPIIFSRGGSLNGTRIYAAKPGFGSQPKKKSKSTDRPRREKRVKDPVLQAEQILAKKQEAIAKKQEAAKKEDKTIGAEESADAPSLIIAEDKPTSSLDEADFERKLAEVKRLAEEQKKVDEAKKYGAIDYDAPLPASPKGLANNILAQFGIGLAVIVFGLLFALGDNIPYFSPKAEKSGLVEKMQLKPDEVAKLEAQVKDLVATLQKNPDDRIALEGAGVIYAQLGDFDKAAEYLSKIVQKSPRDVEAQRLLAEVQAGKGDFDASIAAYRAAIRASPESMSLLQGLTDTLLAAKKPGEAVGELLAARARLQTLTRKQLLVPNPDDASTSGSSKESAVVDSSNYEQIDPIQVELLLGKSYAAWGKPGDAVSVYDGLIANYPEDFRGYLAKGVLLKDQGKTADSERMFIQARYLAPPEAKATVDKYSGRQGMAS